MGDLVEWGVVGGWEGMGDMTNGRKMRVKSFAVLRVVDMGNAGGE